MLITSCGVMQKSAKTEFTNGYYHQKTLNKKQLVYVNIEDDTLFIHLIKKVGNHSITDTTSVGQFYANDVKREHLLPISFISSTLDIDFITIPLKFRPQQKGVPPQLNANLNGAVYIGIRTDRYNISYKTNPLGVSLRNTNHYGFSCGVFTGLGNAAMNATTTSNYLSSEYDAILWTKGIAGIFAINNFTVGLSLGFDNLLDNNRAHWIYEIKPWLGLAFGLNLN